MNREILFRGKRADNGEWIEGFFCECPCDDGTDIPSIMRIESKENHRALMQYPVISETVGRFIGLTDRNGRKIFEGDIISYNGSKEVVYFDTSLNIPCFTTGIGRGSSTVPHPYKISKRHVVIGNIHDNPELLKGEPNV